MTRKRKAIFVQDSVVDPRGQRGVNRCFLGYTRALAGTFPGQVLVYSSRVLDIPGARFIRPISRVAAFPALGSRLARFDCAFGGALADLYAGIFYSPFYGHIRTRIKQVFTAYDMIYEKFPQYFSPSAAGIGEHIQEKKECFERAALIICISKNTAKDILETYPQVPDDRVRVVYIGVDSLFFEEFHQEHEVKPYLLFVGNRGVYKNFTRFLRAFGRSGLSRDFDLRIVSPTGEEITSSELDEVRKFRLGDHVTIETSISDSRIHERYHQAYALVYPSEYEGFGLPILEAMASGTLVLTSCVSALPEIGGDVPLYFDPQSEDSITETLLVAGRMSSSQRQERIKRGRAHAHRFTWQASQENFVRAVQSVC